MKKRLILILNGKGGVGKSFFAVNFIQHLKDRRIRHVAIDTDNENSTLKRFHANCVFVDLSKPSAVDPVFRELTGHSLVVVDCRAASTDIFLSYFTKMNAFDVFKELGAALTVILPINNDPDSVKQVQVLTDKLSDRAGYIVVKNRFFGEKFDIYDKSKTRLRLLDELDGKEIEMPVLEDWLVVALNQATTTITPALRSDKFFIMDRQRLLNWQRVFYAQLESAHDLLLTPEKPSAKRKEASHE
jgi:CobQ/CobB/MinD/ParA nucleotide binding domain